MLLNCKVGYICRRPPAGKVNVYMLHNTQFPLRNDCQCNATMVKHHMTEIEYDRLFGMVVSMCDCHPRGPGLDSRLYPRNHSGSIGYGTGSTQPREDN